LLAPLPFPADFLSTVIVVEPAVSVRASAEPRARVFW
jgi:hypothetical protein